MADTGRTIIAWSGGVLELLAELEPYETMTVLEFAVARHIQSTLPRESWRISAEMFAQHVREALEQQLPPARTKPPHKGGS